MTEIELNLLASQISSSRAALIDMDGVLYDSMKYHTLAWRQVMAEVGIVRPRDEFYLYEGMTGAATIRLLWERSFHRSVSDSHIRHIYARKSLLFERLGRKEPMAGADRMLAALAARGLGRVLVTGSSQKTILDSIATDYPGAFGEGMRVTAADVSRGKPDPEPYLKGLALAGVGREEAIVVENAPLGVRAGKAAGIFTIAVTTGPIPREAFETEGADLIFPDMPAFADALESL